MARAQWGHVQVEAGRQGQQHAVAGPGACREARSQTMAFDGEFAVAQLLGRRQVVLQEDIRRLVGMPRASRFENSGQGVREHQARIVIHGVCRSQRKGGSACCSRSGASTARARVSMMDAS